MRSFVNKQSYFQISISKKPLYLHSVNFIIILVTVGDNDLR